MWEAVDSAEDASVIKPAPVGAIVPEDLMVYGADGEKISLRSQLDTLNLLVVYRGGWCPFCTRQLSGLGALQKDLGNSGVKMLGLSPDGPKAFAATKEKFELPYTLLGDPQQEAIARFGLRFKLDAATTKKYKSYKLPLVADADGAFHLPVPEVYLIDQSGTIKWAYSNPDFRVRPDVDAIMKVINDLKAQ